MNEPADDRDQQEHRGGKPVDIKSDRHLKAAGADPGIEREADWRALSDIDKRARSQHERPQYRRHGDPMRPASDPMPEQADHDERGEWEERDERVLHRPPLVTPSPLEGEGGGEGD